MGARRSYPCSVLLLTTIIPAISTTNFLIWILDPFASYMAVGLQKSLQATICSRRVFPVTLYCLPRSCAHLLISRYLSIDYYSTYAAKWTLAATLDLIRPQLPQNLRQSTPTRTLVPRDLGTDIPTDLADRRRRVIQIGYSSSSFRRPMVDTP